MPTALTSAQLRGRLRSATGGQPAWLPQPARSGQRMSRPAPYRYVVEQRSLEDGTPLFCVLAPGTREVVFESLSMSSAQSAKSLRNHSL